MIKNITTPRPFITDININGMSKKDGFIPAHPGGGALQLSQNRWIIFFATLDPAGWDMNRHIAYQIRSDSPTGPLVNIGTISTECHEDWPVLDGNGKYIKSIGMPIAFGVPKNASPNGITPMPNSNLFVLKWYRCIQKFHNGKWLHPRHSSEWEEGPDIQQRTLRIEWLQFNLNESDDDINILTHPKLLRQKGFYSNNIFCEHGPSNFMNHSMTPPSPLDKTYTSWLEYDTIVEYNKYPVEHGSLAGVIYEYNPIVKLYEWTKLGPKIELPSRCIGESCCNIINGTIIVSARSFTPDGATCWFKFLNPLGKPDRVFIIEHPKVPRTSFLCADGMLRLISNDIPLNEYSQKRTPLCIWDVDISNDFKYANKQLLCNAESFMPFHSPFLDMAKICPAQNNQQTVLFRAITRRQTAFQDMEHPITPNEHHMAGIWKVDLIFQNKITPIWNFVSNHTNNIKGLHKCLMP